MVRTGEVASSYRDLFDLTGRVAVVTGGAGGLGAEVARGLGDFGARVVVADLDRGGAEKVAATIVAATADAVDVTDRASTEALADRVLPYHLKVPQTFPDAGDLVAPWTVGGRVHQPR